MNYERLNEYIGKRVRVWCLNPEGDKVVVGEALIKSHPYLIVVVEDDIVRLHHSDIIDIVVETITPDEFYREIGIPE